MKPCRRVSGVSSSKKRCQMNVLKAEQYNLVCGGLPEAGSAPYPTSGSIQDASQAAGDALADVGAFAVGFVKGFMSGF